MSIRLTRQSVLYQTSSGPEIVGILGDRATTFSPPRWAGTSAPSGDPSVTAVVGHGLDAAHWVEARQSRSDLRVRTPAGQSALSTPTLSGCPAAVAWTGGTEVAWTQDSGVWTSRQVGAAFGMPVLVSGDMSPGFPSLASDGKGRTWCAWRVQDSGGRYWIRLAERASGSAPWVRWDTAIQGMDPSLVYQSGLLWLGYHLGWDCRVTCGAANSSAWAPTAKPRRPEAALDAQGHFVGLAAGGGRVVASWSRWAQIGDDKRDDLRSAAWATLSLPVSGITVSGKGATQVGHQLYPSPYATERGCGVVWVDGAAGTIQRAGL